MKPSTKAAVPCHNSPRLKAIVVSAIFIMVLSLSLRAQTNCASVPDGIVSWWAAEGDASDTTGTNNGVLQGGLTFAAGEVGQAFSMNGSSSYVSVPASSSLDVGSGNGLTFECWIRPDDLSGGHAIAEWNNGSGGIGAHLWISIPAYGGLGSIFANLRDPSGSDHYFSTSPGILTLSNPQHIALTYDRSSGVATIYYNGTAAATQSFGTVTPQTSYTFYLGKRPSETSTVFKGLMDEASLYSRALSSAEILTIYNADSFGKCTTPTGPAIITQPTSQTVVVGANVTFNVSASGTAPLSYQWQKGTSPIAGATSSSYTILNVQSNDAGGYSVVVTNAYGPPATSSNALLTVNPAPPCVPVPSGLVSWWTAEGNANDSFGGNNGSLNGVTFAPGEVSQAFSFDSNSSVSFAASSSLDVGTANGLTIEGWIKPTDVSSDHIIAEWNNASGAIGVQLYHSNPGIGGVGALAGNIVSVGGADHIFASAPGLVTANTFHHIAMTYDRTSGLGRLFYDGNAVAVQNMGFFTPRTSYGLYVGTRVSGSAGVGDYFKGLIDELSLYARALTTNEIQAIFIAGSSGKCTTPTGPSIYAQPQDQTVLVGANATFSVGASGTQPLSYQWYFNGSNLLAGATASSLTISNAQRSDAGLYSVNITNSVDSTSSSNAVLTVNFPPALVKVPTITSVPAGEYVTVPVLLAANGNENALSFSLNYNSSKLTYVSNSAPAGSGETLLINDSQTNSGQLGLALALSSGSTFPAGTQDVADVTFVVAIVTNASTVAIGFGDSPVGRQLSDAHSHTLAANYANGSVSVLAAQLEGDVSPQPGGDEVVTVTDWVLVGLFAAGLDSPANGIEFQRADCAPRSTLGDGRISIIDWVQAGRYAARLDPLTVAGGPTDPGAAATAAVKYDGPRQPSTRQIQAGSATVYDGLTGTISVKLLAVGNENAAGFSLFFDPTNMVYSSATLGNAAGNATLNINTQQISAGHLGLALALSSGASFPEGTDELIKVTFKALPTANGNYNLGFGDQPIYREVSDANANTLATDYLNGTVTVNPLPTLRIWAGDQGLGLAWPSWATNFVLQENAVALSSPGSWTNVTATASTTNNEKSVTVPISPASKFYRLLKQ